MFLFGGSRRDSRRSSPEPPPETEPPLSPSARPTREFLAFRAARLLGGAARQVGEKIARLTTAPSAEALRAELESKAASVEPEVLAATLGEWATLLGAADDAPRYELEGGHVLTFRAAFLRSRAFELVVAAAGQAQLGAGAEREPEGTARVEHWANPDEPSWQAFLRGSSLVGGEKLALQLPDLFSQTRRCSELRHLVEEATITLKADARHELMRSDRTVAGERAERIRTTLSAARRQAQGGGGGGEAGPGEKCRSSAEAVNLYAGFSSGLGDAASHLRKRLSERTGRLSEAQQELRRLDAEAAEREAEAAARREDFQQQRDKAVAAPRRRFQELEANPLAIAVDNRVRELEERRRRLQSELDDASQALAAKRDARLGLLRRREEAVAEHRRRAEEVESRSKDLRPASFHRVIAPRATTMTEGEILAGLVQATECVNGLVEQGLAAASSSAQGHAAQCDTLASRVDWELSNVFRRHAELEIAQLAATSAAVEAAIGSLLDSVVASAQAERMGRAAEEPDRRHMRRMRKAMAAAQAVWEEAAARWGEDEASAPPAALLEHHAEDAAAVRAALEEARARIIGGLDELRRADPKVHRLAMHAIGADSAEAEAEPSSRSTTMVRSPSPPQLPHGWQAHISPEGHIYFHSHVTGETQWEQPEQDAAIAAGWQLVQAENGMWFYHNPYTQEGVWWPELPQGPADPAALAPLAGKRR